MVASVKTSGRMTRLMISPFQVPGWKRSIVAQRAGCNSRNPAQESQRLIWHRPTWPIVEPLRIESVREAIGAPNTCSQNANSELVAKSRDVFTDCSAAPQVPDG